MNWENVANSKIVADLGLTLFHSLWQIALVSFALYAVLTLTKRVSANFRYAVSLAALFLAFFIPLTTFLSLQLQAVPNLDERAIPATVDSAADNNTSAAVGITKTIARNAPLPVADGNIALSFQRSFPAALPIAVGLWLLGVAFFSFRILGGFWQIRRYKTTAVSLPTFAWAQRFNDLCSRLQIR